MLGQGSASRKGWAGTDPKTEQRRGEGPTGETQESWGPAVLGLGSACVRFGAGVWLCWGWDFGKEFGHLLKSFWKGRDLVLWWAVTGALMNCASTLIGR